MGWRWGENGRMRILREKKDSYLDQIPHLDHIGPIRGRHKEERQVICSGKVETLFSHFIVN